MLVVPSAGARDGRAVPAPCMNEPRGNTALGIATAGRLFATFRNLPGIRRRAVAGFARATSRQPNSLRSASLWQADSPERVFKPAGLGVFNRRKPCCLAALWTAKFLGRYGRAIYGAAEPADDDQDITHNNLHGHALRRSTIAFITLTLVLLKTQSLGSHPLYLFIECADLVGEQCVLRLLCIVGTQFIERLLNGEFVDLSHDCCLPGKRKTKRLGKRLATDNRRKSFRLDGSLLVAPTRLPRPHRGGSGDGSESSLIEGTPACAGCSRHSDKIPSIIMVAEMAGSLIQIKPPSAHR